MAAKKVVKAKSKKAIPADITIPERDLGKEAADKAEENRAALKEAIPLKKPKPNTLALGDKLTALFRDVRSTLMESHDDSPKQPRMLRLALISIQLAEDAVTRHLLHNG